VSRNGKKIALALFGNNNSLSWMIITGAIWPLFHPRNNKESLIERHPFIYGRGCDWNDMVFESTFSILHLP